MPRDHRLTFRPTRTRNRRRPLRGTGCMPVDSNVERQKRVPAMRTIDEINTDLRALWREFFPSTARVYAPMQYKAPQPDALVFVGMNPSFSSKGWKSIVRRSTWPELDPHAFFQWPSPQDFDEALAHELEAMAHESYPFFAPHRALAKALETSWEHFDIFAYRETDQAKMRTLALVSGGKIELTEFGQSQFALFEELLLLARPSAVIVVNALASQVYLTKRSPMFDSSVGFYRDSSAKESSFPVFFTGMLTGARALDRFSKDRLFWQVANALGKTWRAEAQPFVPSDA